jgi:lipid A 3-O-deacylase
MQYSCYDRIHTAGSAWENVLFLLNRFHCFWWSFIILTVLLSSATAWSKNPTELQTVQLFFENYLFGQTDEYYTNAFQVTWLSTDLNRYRDDKRLPEWSIPIIRAIPFSGDPESLHNVGILIGQQIYTPSDVQATERLENDRPYSGFLYGGLALHSKTRTILDTLEVVIGIVGPAAKAEFAQNTVHTLRNIPTAKGWDNQLHNEPVISFSWQRKWRLYRMRYFDFLGYDLISLAGMTLGNVRVSSNAGGEIRFGYNIPKDFGSDVIRSGAGVSAPIIDRSKSEKKPFGVHLFASSQAEIVLHDIFLDGNTFVRGHHVDKKLLVGDLSIGISFSYDMIKLSYRHLFRTRQFDNQEKGQTIGSLSLTFAF